MANKRVFSYRRKFLIAKKSRDIRTAAKESFCGDLNNILRE